MDGTAVLLRPVLVNGQRFCLERGDIIPQMDSLNTRLYRYNLHLRFQQRSYTDLKTRHRTWYNMTRTDAELGQDKT